MFSIEVRTEGAERKFKLAATAASDLDEPLKRFGLYLRARAIERYKAQDFPPLAESTIRKRAEKGLRSLERKLKRDVRLALGRARKARAPRAGIMQRLMTSTPMRHALEDAVSAQTRGVQNRMAALTAFQTFRRRDLKDRVHGKALSTKQSISLAQREARAVVRAVGAPILGGLPRTVGFVVDTGQVTLRSSTHELWSEAHNEGDAVGHGAKEPKRETIKLESYDVDVLVSILKDALLLPFEEGMHGPAY